MPRKKSAPAAEVADPVEASREAGRPELVEGPVREPRIKVLSETVASQIAAGEVVERPASVLKELLDNALDSGASKIEVEILGAGKTAIRVVDDGCGMSPEECRLAFARHATSKLRELSDLDSIETMGFRGEALNAIASVSEASLVSCDGEKGWKVELSGGELKRELEASPVKGTAIEIRNLFFNTPARLKFLKTDAAERARLTRVLEETALSRLGLSLTFKLEGKLAMKVSPVEGEHALETRVGEVLGVGQLEDLVPVELDRPEAKLRGLVSRPDALVGTRNLQYFFVNGRPVQSKLLQQVLYKVYEERGTKHPACVLFLDVPGDMVDVNVHPQKLEVRFKEEGKIWEAVASALGRTLTLARQPAPLAPDAPPPPLRTASGKPPLVIFPNERKKFQTEVRELAPEYGTKAAESAESPSSAPAAVEIKATQQELVPAKSSSDPAWWTPPYRYLGQLEQTYLVFEAAGGLALVDQHAAAERIRFERYMKDAKDGRPAVQKLMLPVEVELPMSQFFVVSGLKEQLSALGFDIEPFGERTLTVHSVPDAFPLDGPGIKETLLRLSESHDPSSTALEALRHELATIACKASIKAHDKIGPIEALRLLEQLKGCEAPLCPHGRPAAVAMDRGELARRFKRPGPPPLG
jgi:DNA mismatch repair protein MutL